jgi:hypothetical protein
LFNPAPSSRLRERTSLTFQIRTSSAKVHAAQKNIKLIAALDVNPREWLAVTKIETPIFRECDYGQVKKRKKPARSPPRFAPVFCVLPSSGELRPLISLFGPKLELLVPAASHKHAMG